MGKIKLWDKVKVKLTDPQVLALGESQAEKRVAFDVLEAELEVEKAEAKERADAIKAKIAAVDKEIAEIAIWVNSREREQDVEIREEFDDARKMVAIILADTGQPLRTRPMNEPERREAERRLQQPSLFDGGDEDQREASDTEPPPAGDETEDEDEEAATMLEGITDDESQVETTQLEGQTLVNARQSKTKKKNAAAVEAAE